MRPRQTTTRSSDNSVISSSRKGAQFSSSERLGALSGGAQRTTELIQQFLSCMPSLRDTELGCEAKPVSWRTGYKKSPEPSPVNGRPVRLEPCAPGANPKTNKRAFSSPKEGTGLAQ